MNDNERIKTRELMIARRGKPLFAVRIDSNIDGDSNANYVFIEDGDIKFDQSWLRSIQPFEVGNESHRLAKEIFTIGLQAAIRTKVYELKQLESIMKDVNLADCIGNVLIDNTKLLIEVSENINNKTKEIIDVSKNYIKNVSKVTDEKVEKCMKDVFGKVIKKEDIKECMEEAIVENIKPIAVKKKKVMKEEIEYDK